MDMARKVGGSVEEDTKEYKTNNEAWDMIYEWKGTKSRKVCFNFDCNENIEHL